MKTVDKELGGGSITNSWAAQPKRRITMKCTKYSCLLYKIIFVLIISGCSVTPVLTTPEPLETQSTVTISITNTPTQTTTPMLKPVSSSTPTITPMLKPVSSSTPTITPDITTLGDPITPIPEYPSQLPTDFFTYSNQDSFIYEKTLHGRPVTVVFPINSIFTETERQELSDYVFNTFLNIWEIFGGYRTQLFLIRFGSQDNPEGETSVGFRCNEHFLVNELKTQGDWYQPLAHGIFHAWMVATITPASEEEAWVFEGSTQYYGDRFATRARYLREMNYYVDFYRGLAGTKADVSLVESGLLFHSNGTFQEKMIYYYKGALVFYLIDKRMIELGYNLDILMREMYLEFGLTGKKFTTNDVQIALEKITGQKWQSFFDSYVYGTEQLPIDGQVEFLTH
jgi:hypothetical protein